MKQANAVWEVCKALEQAAAVALSILCVEDVKMCCGGVRAFGASGRLLKSVGGKKSGSQENVNDHVGGREQSEWLYLKQSREGVTPAKRSGQSRGLQEWVVGRT